ncbi:tRNA lysidine(34) synthetase TilS [Hydrotalea sandarakina]|jgi:tRNA(Ile)-lysidine synthase|uniref:tRNA(Ile)-lysidine synthase n=1 Tax=Hydrotalea sandarakina TaxID=1004304 RepID=A0A2W7RZH3_9BACT|nr:tRNA lysidine(34) synthetase TilS [Hydrotalea sandarakina]PZX65664.1 tRNA(Ile)-lysidine synthase [Hydrotalea sandarakina]
MNLFEAFQLQWKQKFSYLHPHNCTLLVAVSGGVDSMVLLHCLHKIQFHIAVAHVNFQLRGEESIRDAVFVQQTCEKYNIPFYLKTVNTQAFADEEKISIQVAARRLRYEWFEQLLQQPYFKTTPNAFIVTAHHANDNIETLLHHLFRGTGIAGLQGIPSKNNQIIRPLLFAYKQDIIAYAEQNKLQWVDDSSNKKHDYTRNFIRLQILPQLQQHFPNIDAILTENIERFQEANLLYQQALQNHFKKLIQQNEFGYQIPIELLKKTQPFTTVLWEIAKQFGCQSAQLISIEKLLDAKNGSVVETSTHRFVKNRKWLLIQLRSNPINDFVTIQKWCNQIQYAAGKLLLNKVPVPEKFEANNHTIYIDEAALQFPLIIRKLKTGDYFYPFGMKHKKKISRFLIDLKLSLPQKENVWVLEMNKKIIWVIGYRADNRFKVNANAKQCIKIDYLK